MKNQATKTCCTSVIAAITFILLMIPLNSCSNTTFQSNSDTEVTSTNNSLLSPTETLTPTLLPSPNTPAEELKQTPSVDVPISQTGPWLLYANSYNSQDSWELGIINTDGTGLNTIEIPLSNDHGTASYYIGFDPKLIEVSPKGDLLSILSINDNLAFEIWILKIPTLEVIRKIPLLSQDAVESIISFQGDPSQELSPILPIMQLEDLMEWSPDGSNLAFIGAIKSNNLDVYTYDDLTDSVEQLTDGHTHALLMGWSPDSKWIVHMGVTGYMDGFSDIDQIWAMSADGQTAKPLYKPRVFVFSEEIIGWVSKEVFLSEGWVFEAPIDSVLQVAMRDMTSKKVVNLPSMGTAYDPTNAVFLINASGYLGPGPNINQGLYLQSIAEREPRFTLAGEFYRIQYHSELGLFSVIDSLGELLFIDSSGNVILKLFGVDGFTPSPDGSYLVVPSKGTSSILSRNGQVLEEIDNAGLVAWTPDSEAFFTMNTDGLSVFRAEQNWAQTILNTELDNASWIQAIEKSTE